MPSALMALVLQAALFALLIHSFQRPAPSREAQSEAIFYLPRILQRPPPVVIDARQPPRASLAPSAVPALAVPELAPAPPLPETPPSDSSLLTALRGALGCQPDARGRASPLISCRAIGMPARNDLAALAPALPVAREAEFAAERARANTPGRVPCVSMQTRKMSFGNMSLGQEDHEVMVDPLCVLEELAR